MNLAELPDLVGVVLGFTFTLMIFSYLLGDNPFFRFALHVFIGVASGYALVVVIYNVFWHQVVLAMIDGSAVWAILIPPVLLGIWLVATKPFPRLARFGNVPMAYLVGAGVGTAIGGAVLGTLFPQIGASGSLFNFRFANQNNLNYIEFFLRGLFILAGTLFTLVYFHFGVRSTPDRQPSRHPLIEEFSRLGQFFIALTFGVLFAGVYSAALTALIERLNFIIDTLRPFLSEL
jgi:hypothetical protein